MKIYTGTGDTGETGLWGGIRVTKDSVRIQAYGSVDETNAAIGLARASGVAPDLDYLLAQIQEQLFVIGSDLATLGATPLIPRICAEDCSRLERLIDTLESELEPLKQFILPGGCAAAAHLHLARTICRRTERWVVSLARNEEVNPQVLIYLNRLSDLLFVLARTANARVALPDIPWNSPRMAEAELGG